MVLGTSSTASIIVNTILIILIAAYLVYQGYIVWKRNKVAKMLDEDDFREGMHKGQIIDLREKRILMQDIFWVLVVSHMQL
ncbi:Rhodanese-like domain protein [Pediococcus damnosus]|nr:Rhodanese-like domain protein [Pediococcus damnosus]